MNGATAHLFDPRESGVAGLVRLLKDQRITTISVTPALLRSLAQASGTVVFESLRLVTSGGEGVHGSDVHAVRSHLPKSSVVINRVGATECGRYAIFPIRFDDPVPDGPVPIGFPYPNMQVELVNEQGHPVDQGMAGEVIVTSDCMPDGYWQRPDLTAERYTDLGDGRRSYRTGDLARRDAVGVLHHLGRVDRLVKIRGYRVGPAEIEAALTAMDDIDEAVVIGDQARDDSRTRLVAYVVSGKHQSLPSVAIRKHLRQQLPTYMVPEKVVHLEKLPRTVNGKVDISRLPPVPNDEPREPQSDQSFTSLHWAVRRAFASALDLQTVGLHDDFFELGGDSLAALEVVSALEADYGLSVTASELVESPTIDGLATAIAASVNSWDQGLVTLRLGGAGTPLFCVPGAGGRVLGFMSLARLLCADRPIYGLQARGVDRRGVPGWTVERVARRHLRAVRALQPRGPYLFAGHSAGGWIALEMGHRLRALGEEVTLIWLDTRTVKRTTIGANSEPRAKTPIDVCRRSKRALVSRAALLRQWIKTVEKAWLAPTERTYDDRRNQFIALTRVMLRRYQAKPWPGRAVVYGARESSLADPAECEPLFAGDWDFRWVSGTHGSMLQEPNVRALAQDLARELASDAPSAIPCTTDK
jgi:thioesterase domain-containing protein/acyl carrier protein